MKLSVRLFKEKYYERKSEPFRKDHKIFIHPEGETIFENLINRHNRPYEKYRDEVIPKILDYFKKRDPKVYKLIKDLKWKWSKNCGCSMCPCSPGFHAENINYSQSDVYHISVNIK